jgi:abequosyltransferase
MRAPAFDMNGRVIKKTMKLSICIPTYNRREELLRLLMSIEVALADFPTTDQVEVIVSDNASTDGTELAIRAVQARLPCLLYFRNDANQGFAANLNRVMSLASGTYCWLMGSDDALLPDVLSRLWPHLDGGASVIVGNPVTRSVERKFFLFHGEKEQRVSSEQDYAVYVAQCREISAVFAFMSTLIVNRAFWDRVQCTEYENKHPYAHMLRIVRGLNTDGGNVRCLNAPVVVTGHAGNEWNKTVLPHFELDLSTIKYIVSTIFGSSPALISAYGLVFRRQYSGVELLKSRVESTVERWSAMTPLLKNFGYPHFLLGKTVFDPLLLMLYLLIKGVRALQIRSSP